MATAPELSEEALSAHICDFLWSIKEEIDLFLHDTPIDGAPTSPSDLHTEALPYACPKESEGCGHSDFDLVDFKYCASPCTHQFLIETPLVYSHRCRR